MNTMREIDWPSAGRATYGRIRVMSRCRPVGPRVVFLPGTLGSVLVDQSLTPERAREECERNLGPARDRHWRGRSYYPCDKRPETLWGAVGSLYWFFNPASWLQRLTRGNGYDRPAPVHADSLLDIDLVIWGRRVQVRPYAAFLKALRDAGADVLVFPYDWRLSNRHNTRLLERRVLERWFGGRPVPRERKLRDDERITFIGHSMGGLVARSFLESTPLGPVLGRLLITIGTPHRGAPLAYLHLIGRTLPFPESPFSSWAHATPGAGVEGGGHRRAGRARATAHPREDPDCPRQVHGVHVRTPAELHVTAADLVIQRVEPPPGIGLGRPVQRMLQGTDRIPGNRRSLRGGTSTDGTHRAPP